MAKRGQSDIDFKILYLSGKVDKSTVEDWSKLRRLLYYLKGRLSRTKNEKNTWQIWVDVSYGIHVDMGRCIIIHHKKIQTTIEH